MKRGKPNKSYTAEFKQMVVEAMTEEKLSYRETARRYEVSNFHLTQTWERIYLKEGSEGLAVERRGGGSTGRPPRVPKEAEEDLLTEVQRLRAVNDYLKNCKPWFWKTSDASEKDAGSTGTEAKTQAGDPAGSGRIACFMPLAV